MIPEHLQQRDMTNPCDLPELTDQEIEKAIYSEQVRRAKRLGCSPNSITISDPYRERIIKLARERKKSDQLVVAYWKSVDQGKKIVTLSAKEVLSNFKMVASRIAGREFIIDETNERIVIALSLYFANDPRAKSYDIDLSKGLLLLGGVGVGKTLIMKAFALNQNASFRVVRSRDISYDFADHGFGIVKQYSDITTIPQNIHGQKQLGLCIDDLGTDEERKHYGDRANALAEIVLNRYDIGMHNLTHITTNLNANMIEQVYGLRVRSRMREMFNKVNFGLNAPDRRK